MRGKFVDSGFKIPGVPPAPAGGRQTHIHLVADAAGGRSEAMDRISANRRRMQARVRDSRARDYLEEDLPEYSSPEQIQAASARYWGPRWRQTNRVGGDDRRDDDRRRRGDLRQFRSDSRGDEGGAEASITKRAGSARPDVQIGALRDFARRLRDHYRRRRMTDADEQELYNYFKQWVAEHTDGTIANENVQREDPRVIRAPADNYVLPPRRIMTREELMGRTSGGRNASETMTSNIRDSANPLAVIAQRNRAFWRRAF